MPCRPSSASHSSPRTILPKTYQQRIQNFWFISLRASGFGGGGASPPDRAAMAPTRSPSSFRTAQPDHFGAGTRSDSLRYMKSNLIGNPSGPS